MRPSYAPLVLLAAAALLACGDRPVDGRGIPKSQDGEVTQEVAGTHIGITYRRPVARGRVLFGALVPWDSIWSPGADNVARLTTSGPLVVEGTRLPAGSYGIWMIPDSLKWTVILNSESKAFHLTHTPSADVARVTVVPQRGPHVETVQFSFPLVDADSATLEFAWGETRVPLRLRRIGQ